VKKRRKRRRGNYKKLEIFGVVDCNQNRFSQKTCEVYSDEKENVRKRR
jgi:hypothetical protein